MTPSWSYPALLAIIVKNHKSGHAFQLNSPFSQHKLRIAPHHQVVKNNAQISTATYATISNDGGGGPSNKLDINDDEDHAQKVQDRANEITNKKNQQTTFDLMENTIFLEEALHASYLDLMELNESVSSSSRLSPSSVNMLHYLCCPLCFLDISMCRINR